MEPEADVGGTAWPGWSVLRAAVMLGVKRQARRDSPRCARSKMTRGVQRPWRASFGRALLAMKNSSALSTTGAVKNRSWQSSAASRSLCMLLRPGQRPPVRDRKQISRKIAGTARVGEAGYLGRGRLLLAAG